MCGSIKSQFGNRALCDITKSTDDRFSDITSSQVCVLPPALFLPPSKHVKGI